MLRGLHRESQKLRSEEGEYVLVPNAASEMGRLVRVARVARTEDCISQFRHDRGVPSGRSTLYPHVK